MLDSLLLERVVAELELEASGATSMYFSRKRQHVADGKSYADDATAELERLERDVAMLCERLGGPARSSALSLAYEFTERRESMPKPWDGGNVALARELLSRVKSNPSLERP